MSTFEDQPLSHSKAPSDPAIRAPLPQLWETGKSYDMFDILSSAGRSFLVKNNGDQVPINDVIGKTIGIYVVNSYESKEGNFYQTKYLADCYNKYHPSGEFEVVLVDGDFDEKTDREMFLNCFSKMSWLAIPFEDTESRQRFANLHYTPCLPWCAIFDSTGILLRKDGLDFLRLYGTECFPFTEERIGELAMEEKKWWSEKTLTSLLTSPTRDYLVDNKGTKTLARELEGKTVGLFFYREHMWEECFPCLREIYKRLKEVRGGKFEIVMIDTKFWEPNKFEKACEEMPWLAWPSDDGKYRRRLSECFFYNALMVMIGPNMEFVDEYGFEVMTLYGIDVYPFIRDAAAKVRAMKMRKHSLESILMSHGHKHVMTKSGGEVQISELRGKPVALYFGALAIQDSFNFLGKLIDWYGQIKKKDDRFEIIYVSWDKDEVSYLQNYSKMPWLALPFRIDTKERDLFYLKEFQLYRHGSRQLFAFGSDGKFLTKKAAREVIRHGLDAYPFNDANLFQDTWDEVNDSCSDWPDLPIPPPFLYCGRIPI